MSYLLNTWYVAGWAEELAQDALLGRTLLEKPIVSCRRAPCRDLDLAWRSNTGQRCVDPRLLLF